MTDTFNRRKILSGITAATATSIAGCFGGNEIDDEYTIPDNAVTNVQIPDAQTSYATMGSSDAELGIQYFGSWKCPICARFAKNRLNSLVNDYVKTGGITITFRGLAYINNQPFLGNDAPTAARAGLAVWRNDPENYWTYHDTIMYNQPAESKKWATENRLRSFMEQSGVENIETIMEDMNSDEVKSLVNQTSSDASTLGIDFTPAIEINGRVFVATSDENEIRNVIQQNLEN